MTQASQSLQRFQVLIFAAAIAAGAMAGQTSEAWIACADQAITPALALLLYVTFLQIEVAAIPRVFREWRFLLASLGGNFVVAPLLVGAILWLVPVPPAVQVGIVLVLLAPCTDWFSSFTHLGRGDTRLAVSVTPLLLILQFPLVAFFLWLLTDIDPWTLPQGPILRAAVFVVLIPLLTALLTQQLTSRGPTGQEPGAEGPTSHERVTSASETAMVPLLGIVLFLVTVSSSALVFSAANEMLRAAAIFIAYLLIVPLLTRWLARSARLTPEAGRTLLFNLGTRNSFVMLPIALAMPAEYALAVPVIAAQSVVELAGMLAYLRLIDVPWFGSQPRR